VEAAYRDGACSLAAAEGFIRQVLGWREYVRGVYWLAMPGYAERNTFGAERPLPDWFWSADTDLRCLQRARPDLEHGYAHHIQRLMVIGNFALLAGLDVRAVCDWYLAVYVDAFEWVELPNTLGMALHADEGLMASKPYAASGKYIQRQGNHCAQCRYDPQKTTGEGACPYQQPVLALHRPPPRLSEAQCAHGADRRWLAEARRSGPPRDRRLGRAHSGGVSGLGRLPRGGASAVAPASTARLPAQRREQYTTSSQLRFPARPPVKRAFADRAGLLRLGGFLGCRRRGPYALTASGARGQSAASVT
jgi:hypothetical protein